MTRTAARLRWLARPQLRARALAVVLTGAGAALALAAAGVALAPRLGWVLGVWVAILSVVLAAARAVRRARRASRPPHLARLVEGSTDARPGSIETLVALPGAGTSAELFDAADARAARAVEGAAPAVRRALSRSTRRRLGLALTAAALGAVVFVAASPGSSGATAFWHPLRAIRDARAPVRLAVDRRVVRRGETVRVTVEVRGGSRAILWTRAPGEQWRPTPVALDSAGRAIQQLGPLTADLHLRAASGRRSSRELTISVTSPPFLADIALTARYPAYLGRPEEPLVPGPDTVALPVGTEIVAHGTASAPLASAAWTGPGRGARLEVDGDAFGGRFVPVASGTWSLAVTARSGPLEGDPPELVLRLVPDAAPLVQLPVPGRDTVLPLSLRQPLVIDAQDDHGLSRLVLVSWRVARTGRVGERLAETLELGNAGDRAVLQAELDLRERGLLPGDTVRLVVEAWDNAPTPQVGRSAELALRLPSMEELRAQTRAAARGVAAAAESLAAAQSELGDRTRDLAQGRSREDTPAAGRQPGAQSEGRTLPFQARERAEDLARQQAELGQRIEELREAVEDIARAARAAGVGDTAFEARLAEVRELLRRAVTPELEARLRELEEALSRLDPEATREALRQLAEAQEELRRELERSQELFRRAAVEGELASLAADADALRQRQEEWNTEEGPRADSAAAAVERVLAELTDSLAAGIRQAGRDLAPKGQTPDAARLAAQRAAAQRAQAAMQRAAAAAEAGDPGQAVEQGEEAAEELRDLPEELRAERDSLAAAWRRETLEALDRALSETAALAERQEDVVDALRVGQTGAPTRARQAAVEEGTQAIERQIREAASRHALVSSALERALGYAEHQMRAARQQLEQGDPNTAAAAALAQEALDALNATAYALARSRSDVAAARSGSGFQEAVEQLARLAGQQRGVNADAQSLIPMMGPGSQAMLQQLRALAARQRALAQQLERLQAGGMSGAAGPLAQEARELARQLEQGRLDRQTVERQERLYRRLLDAGRTLRGEEPDETRERVSRSATGDTVHRPPALRPGVVGSGPRLRYPTWDELRGLTAEERRLVLEYFRRLNEPR